MGQTFVEKALARAAGLPSAVAGQIVDVTPDVVLSHDNSAAIARIFRDLGLATSNTRNGWRSRWTTPCLRRRRCTPPITPRYGAS